MNLPLLPCPFKALTGCDCPACGMQRSIIQLVQGQWEQSVTLHPVPAELTVLFACWLITRLVTPYYTKVVLRFGAIMIALSTLIFYLLKVNQGSCCT